MERTSSDAGFAIASSTPLEDSDAQRKISVISGIKTNRTIAAIPGAATKSAARGMPALFNSHPVWRKLYAICRQMYQSIERQVFARIGMDLPHS